MRRLMTILENGAATLATGVNRATLGRVVCVTAVVGGLALAQGFAKEPAPEAAIPACLENLKLTAPQQTQAKEVVRTYDAKIEAVWKQFGDRYMETVQTEVALLAAIEDNLTDAQRTHVRDLRRKAAHAELALEGTKSRANKATAKPADPVSAELNGAEIKLTPEQEAAADKIHQKYVGHLRSLNRDIQGLHTRLVSLEADKLVELEKMLTKEQLAQLREGRQNVTGSPKITTNE